MDQVTHLATRRRKKTASFGADRLTVEKGGGGGGDLKNNPGAIRKGKKFIHNQYFFYWKIISAVFISM